MVHECSPCQQFHIILVLAQEVDNLNECDNLNLPVAKDRYTYTRL